MTSHDESPNPNDVEDDNDDPGFAGGGGPASIIYGDDDQADETGKEMLKAPDESS